MPCMVSSQAGRRWKTTATSHRGCFSAARNASADNNQETNGLLQVSSTSDLDDSYIRPALRAAGPEIRAGTALEG